MKRPPGGRHWTRSILTAGAAIGVLIGSFGPGDAAYAVAVPSTSPAPNQKVAVDTEVSARSNSYLDSVLEHRADSRVKALGAIDQRADAYAVKLAAEAELQAALLSARPIAEGGLVAPLATFARTSHFGEAGPLWETTHTGEDFAAPTGTPLVAIGGGVVTDVGDAGAYGLRTIITLTNGTELWYCHQSMTVVKTGSRVTTGQPIGAVGATGNTTGPHLHLEVRPNGAHPIDPVAWLAALGVFV